jgi:predicted dehydrogenase
MMDIFLMLGGLPREVFGQTRTVMHEIEVEDEAQALLTYDNGAVGYAHITTCEPQPGPLLQIYGDGGKLKIEGDELSFARYRTPVGEFSDTTDSMWDKPEYEEVPLELPECDSGQVEMMRNFARAVLYDDELYAPAEAGLHQLELSNAIMLSSWTGESVSIPVDRDQFNSLLEERIANSSFQPGSEKETKRVTDPKLG